MDGTWKIIKKQSRTADRGWFSSLGVGLGAKTLHRKTPNLLFNVLKRLGPGWILRQNDPSTENWISGFANGMLGASIR
jgi:hypothetical protein